MLETQSLCMEKKDTPIKNDFLSDHRLISMGFGEDLWMKVQKQSSPNRPMLNLAVAWFQIKNQKKLWSLLSTTCKKFHHKMYNLQLLIFIAVMGLLLTGI